MDTENDIQPLSECDFLQACEYIAAPYHLIPFSKENEWILQTIADRVVLDKNKFFVYLKEKANGVVSAGIYSDEENKWFLNLYNAKDLLCNYIKKGQLKVVYKETLLDFTNLQIECDLVTSTISTTDKTYTGIKFIVSELQSILDNISKTYVIPTTYKLYIKENDIYIHTNSKIDYTLKSLNPNTKIGSILNYILRSDKSEFTADEIKANLEKENIPYDSNFRLDKTIKEAKLFKNNKYLKLFFPVLKTDNLKIKKNVTDTDLKDKHIENLVF